MKKFLSLLLCVMMVVCFMPAMAWADEICVAKIGDKEYTSLGAAVEDVPAGNTETTIVLQENVTGGGVKVEKGKNIVIDFNGKTYTVGQPTVGSSGTETNGFQLLKGSKVTMKNGILKASNYVNLQILIQNYCDLTLENITIDASGATNCGYAVSNNHGNVLITGKTSIIAQTGKVAFDVYYWPSNSYEDGVSVTVNTTGKISGNIEYGSDKTDPGKADIAEKASLTIKSGEFDGTISTYGLNSNGETGITISGGTFTNESSNAAEYVIDGMTVNDRGTVIIDTQTAVAKVNGVGYTTLQAALDEAKDGDTIELLQDVESASKIELPAGVTLDGNGKSISLTNEIGQGAFIETSSDDVTIQDVIINTNGNAKHGVQFYCANDGKLENVTVNGGFYTSVIVNGAKVAIENCTLNPDTSESPEKNAYANIEYAMGDGVTTLPEITVSNVTGSPEKPLVYADENTLIRAKGDTSGDDVTISAEEADEVAKTINTDKLQGATISYVITDSAPVPGTMFYTITFNANGGTVTPTSAVTNEAGLLSSLPTPKRSGSYSFKGWYTAASGGTKVTESTEFKANTTIYAQWEYTGVIYVPTTPTVQKPAIEADSNATVTLDSTGTTATITVADGYELADVTVNGVSKGAVTTLTGLKTGDKVVVTTKKTEEPPVVDDSARIKAGVQATTLKIYSKSLNTKGSGKGWIQVRWVKSKGFKVDGYELYRGKTKSTMKRYDTTTKTTYTNKNYLKKGNRYYYKVRGYRMIDGEKVYTQWSKTIYRLAK